MLDLAAKTPLPRVGRSGHHPSDWCRRRCPRGPGAGQREGAAGRCRRRPRWVRQRPWLLPGHCRSTGSTRSPGTRSTRSFSPVVRPRWWIPEYAPKSAVLRSAAASRSDIEVTDGSMSRTPVLPRENNVVTSSMWCSNIRSFHATRWCGACEEVFASAECYDEAIEARVA